MVIPQEVLRQASRAGQCHSLHRMGLLPDLTMDNAAGLRLKVDPSEAYEHLGTNGRTEVKQYTPLPVEWGYNKAPMTYDHAWFCY